VEQTFRAVMNAEHHHTAIRVNDMAKMMAFYGEVLGLPYIRQVDDAQGPRQVWYQAVQLNRVDEPVDPAAGTMDHLAVSVLNIEDLVGRLTKAGAALEAPIAHSDYPAIGLQVDNIFFRDPEGNRVELVQWVPLRR
jgi:catechol 2,3-dioxygenase-like lactoylglutathione lyase family enzyme